MTTISRVKCRFIHILGLALLCGPLMVSAQEGVLAGWHDFSAGYGLYKSSSSPKSADTTAVSGVGGVLWSGTGSRNTWGSTDGNYGPTEPVGSTVADGAMSLRTDTPFLYFSVTNASSTAVILNRVLFDFASVNGNSPQNLRLFYASGDLDDADDTLIAAWSDILNGLSMVSDHEDVEVNLNVLSDQILAPGETATFLLVPDTAINNTQAMSIDNVAVTGAATASELRVLTYNIHGGYGPDGEGTPSSNLTAFRNSFMNDEDVLCLQEVDNGDCWTAVQTVFSDYPYQYRTMNETTKLFSNGETSIAIISKYPFLSTHSQLIQTDPGGDKWERHAQHVTIQLGSDTVHIFNFHNTYNWFNNDYEYEKLGLTRFRDNYLFPRLGISSVAEADRLIMLGDFNVLHANVTAILNPPELKYNGLDHVASAPLFTKEGVYATAAADLSDHNSVWAQLDVQPPAPDPMTWLSAPVAVNRSSVHMTATSAADPSSVEYYFINTTVGDGSHDSGWQSSPIYTDRGLTPDTAYSYTVITRDKSANANETTASEPASATTLAVASLPYAESFETGDMADWVQVMDDDYDWMVHSGGTPTAASGPSGASDGIHYLYAEGHHGQGPYKTASVESSFDFSTVTAAFLKFDYHMYGYYIDYLALDIYDGAVWTSNVWTKIRQQHSGSDDPWSQASLDLSAYAGNSNVTMRFRTANLQWFAADPAVDRIRIVEENNAPAANAQAIVTDENSAAAITLSGSDVDDDILSYIVVAGPTNGTLSGSAPDLTYTPHADYYGPDSFTFTADDGLTNSFPATVSITVNEGNDPPVAVPDAVETEKDSTVAGNVLTNDTDEEGDSLVVTGVDTSALIGLLTMGAPSVIGEVGVAPAVSDVPITVTLSRDYQNPVVIAQPPSFAGSDAAVVRITSVANNSGSTDSFTLFIQEAPNLDGAHGDEVVHYLVVEAGSWRLPEGQLLEVGTLNTSNCRSSGSGDAFVPVALTAAFSTTPAVVSQVQSYNGISFVKTRQQGASASSFNVILEEAQGDDGSHSAETIGYIAVETGSSYVGSLQFVAGIGSLSAEADEGSFESLPFGVDLGSTPGFVAALATYGGSDPCGLRYQSLSGTEVTLTMEEDTNGDTETGHAAEDVAFIAFSSTSADLYGSPEGAINDGSFLYDPNGQFDSLLPEHSTNDVFSYIVQDGNGGTDVTTVTVTVNGDMSGTVIMVR